MRHLLDVNVWVALLDEAHVFHGQALAFIERRRVQTAPCPLVENGVVRVLNLPGYSKLGPVGFEVVAQKVAEICASVDHAFWPDDVSLRTPGMVNWPWVPGYNQITDLCLLALAVVYDGCLVALDHRVSTSKIVGATDRHPLRLQVPARDAMSTTDQTTASRWVRNGPTRFHVATVRQDVSINACTKASTRIGFVT